MTTNARDEKWSEWKPHGGGPQPITNGTIVEPRLRDGTYDITAIAEDYRWQWDDDDRDGDIDGDIIAYRYKIKEPESDMHPDLEWLAEVQDEWCDEYSHAYVNLYNGVPNHITFNDGQGYTRAQWQAARQQLGLDSTGIADPDEEECLQLAYERIGDESLPTSVKQLRYQDAKGEDWIDEFARTATIDEFRGAMRFTIGKYNRRAGKKDELIKEIEKMRDYCERWLEYERKVGQ